jgi:hypothetical protein
MKLLPRFIIEIRTIAFVVLFSSFVSDAFADLKYKALRFHLSTEKASYTEGETITFILEMHNSDKDSTYPIILPHTQNTGYKLLYLKIFDKTGNAHIERFTDLREINMMVHDTGTVMFDSLGPGASTFIKLHWNDFDDHNSYHTRIESHHTFGVPLFAGEYRAQVIYNPAGIPNAHEVYAFEQPWWQMPIQTDKYVISNEGEASDFCPLIIRKTAARTFEIEGRQYEQEWKDERWWCYHDSIGKGGANMRLVYVSDLPKDSSSLARGEYYYTHFTDQFAEYIRRKPNGDIIEYRKYRDNCPEELLTFRFDDFGNKTYFATKLYDGRFYTIAYHDDGRTHREMYYSGDGTLCVITDWIYDDKKELLRKQETITTPCLDIELDGKSYRKVEELIEQ